MKTLIATVLAATTLSGCVVAPAYPVAGVYVAPPPPVVVYRPYYYYYQRRW